jgi:multidrug resistance efflux pump
MTSDQTARDTRAQIREEHRQIKELTHRIEHTPDLAELGSGLEELAPLFERHFAREESLDGLHSNIRDRAPQHAAAIDRLKEEHGELLSDVSTLRAQVAACLQGRNQIEASCSELVRKIKEHEARENEVFLDAICTDLGTGD